MRPIFLNFKRFRALAANEVYFHIPTTTGFSAAHDEFAITQ